MSAPLRDRLEALLLEEVLPTPTTVMVAFTLMMEEPGLPPEIALLAAEEGGPFTGPIVDPLELLRLTAVGYRLEQT